MKRLALNACGFTLAALALAACATDEPAAGGELVVGYIGGADTSHTDAWRGAQLGAEEAAHAARLIGRGFRLVAAHPANPADAAAAARRLLDEGVTVLVGGDDLETCRALAAVADSARVLFLNTGCREDALRGRSDYTFHVQVSDAMRRDPGDGPSTVRPETRVVWHGQLGRYGAAQLNRRFSERFGAFAGEDAWAAWMAMKIAWETAQQVQSTDPDALRSQLTSGDAEFDGHKGRALTFDAATHQLRQPLFPAPAGATSEDAGYDARTIIVEGADALRAATAAGARLALVTNEGSSSVTVIDTRTLQAIATIALAARPRGIRASADGATAYVALSDDAPTSESDADGIAVIDLRRAEITALHDAGSDPEQFALSPDGARLYAANEDAGTATITDLASDGQLATLVVGIEPEGVAVSPDGRWVYVTAETSNTVSVIDTRTNEVAASFLVDIRPRAAAFSPDGHHAFVSNEISGTLSVIEVPGHRVVATIPLARGAARPVGITVAPDGSRVYVANGRANSISVIDPAVRREVAVVKVGERPWGIEASADGRFVYTANGGSNDMSVVDARTLQVIATVPAGDRPWGVAVTP